MELTDTARAELEAYLAGNPRGKDGRVVYDLRGDFGLDPADLYERFAFYFEAFPQITAGGALMAGIHRERPGADAIAPCRGDPPIDLGDGIWMSPGLSNSYLIATDDGHVDRSTPAWGSRVPCANGPTPGVADGPRRAIILTQGHYDHVGGVDVLREDGTEVIAQANFSQWRDDNERLEAFRSRNAAFAWIDAIVAAMDYARSSGVGAVAQARPEPTMVFDDRLELTVGGRRLELLSVPGGETTDALVVWLPDSRTVFVGNLTGPLFGHVPNLVTIRGDRYRDALTHIASLDRVRSLGAERLVTGHFDPIDGAERIHHELTAMHDAIAVGARPHRRRHERRHRRPHPHARHRRPRPLRPRRGLRQDLAGTSGPSGRPTRGGSTTAPPPSSTRCRRRRSAATSWPPPGPTRCCRPAGRTSTPAAPSRRCTSPTSSWPSTRARAPGRALAADASRVLLAASSNFWETAWLRRSIDTLEGAP